MSAVSAPKADRGYPLLLPGLPDHDDLPDSDGKPVPNAFHPIQTQLLTSCLHPVISDLHPDGQFFVGQDNGIYYLLTEDPLDGCKSPDWYYVPNVPPTLDGRLRRSYVMWQELRSPLVVVEYASRNGSEERDRTPRTGKMWVYEQVLHVPYYFIFHPERDVRIEAYRLDANEYVPMTADRHGRFRVPQLGVAFGMWLGRYLGIETTWLRAWDEDEFMLPSAVELAAQAVARAELEKRFADAARQLADEQQTRADEQQSRADAEKERADALAAKLRALGIDPDAA